MRKNLLPLVILLISCTTKKIHDKIDVVISPSKISNKQFFILDSRHDSNIKKTDSLFVHHDDSNGRCSLIWKKDTIATESTWENSTNFISSLGAIIGHDNTFLMSIYAGDGCPVVYKLLAFKSDTSYFLSESFGNCNNISSMKMDGHEIEFYFSPSPEINRHGVRYMFNPRKFSVKEQ